MEPEVALRLIEINRTFYQQFAGEFDATRQRPQPGVWSLMEDLAGAKRVLDLGCGNGQLWNSLCKHGFEGEYIGLDFSAALLEAARTGAPDHPPAQFLMADLAAPGWEARLDGLFDRIIAFAVLHHLPPPAHQAVVRAVRERIAPEGRFMLSNWMFTNSPRWQSRRQPWSIVGLEDEQIGHRDFLLDWRRGGIGYRYIHLFDEAELHALADETGFTIEQSFLSDGAEGNLGLYQIWRPAPKANQPAGQPPDA